MTPKIFGRKYKVIQTNDHVNVGDILTLIKDDGDNAPLFIGSSHPLALTGTECYVNMERVKLLPEEPSELDQLRARVAKLESELSKYKPKPEWWEQYKVGDKIDLIGVEITAIDTSQGDVGARIQVKQVTESFNKWMWFDDRHIRPHQP